MDDNTTPHANDGFISYLPLKKKLPATNTYPSAVGIILRTKDRPACLPRALASIKNQTFTDWHLVIVNDGGNATVVTTALAPFKDAFGKRLTVINHDKSHGRGPAVNVGIKACATEFIVLHDDDDSWHPDFLQETVAFLRNEANTDCGGVICQTTQVIEEIKGNQLIEKQRNDYISHQNPYPRISLYRLLMQNTYAPISFLFRRSVVDEIGYFNDLPVLEDWDFNIRTILSFEIGVLFKHLAFYHHRLNQDAAYANSIIAESALCLQYETLIRNNSLRHLLSSPNHKDLLGLFMALGGQEMQNVMNPHKMDNLLKQVNTLNQATQQMLLWLDQNLRQPLAADLSAFQKQLQEIQAQVKDLHKIKA